jgi:hypothetical protein
MGMKVFVADKVLKVMAKKVDGHKTKIGGISSILGGTAAIIGGVLGLVATYFPDSTVPSVPMDLETAWATLAGGWAAMSYGFSTLGAGGKSEKLKAAILGGGQLPPAAE